MYNIRISEQITRDTIRYVLTYIVGTKISILDACKWVDGGMFIQNDKFNVVTVNSVSVHKDIRGTGVGNKLMEVMCDIADKKGYTLELGVSPDMSPGGLGYKGLVRFYKKFGFKCVKEMPSIMVRYLK